jgi:GNAT-family acetyltransferase (TIGR03103 family)
LLQRAGLKVPDQIPGDDEERIRSFLETHGRVVVKPARGEMGRGVAVDLASFEDVKAAAVRAARICDDVIVEQCADGQDLRIIVIDGEVVAAAVRRPPRVQGDGVHTIVELIAKQSRRREAATHGESTIPLDEETERCVESHDHQMLDVPAYGETVTVRKTANLHAGGTIHDVTADLHRDLKEAAVKGAGVLEIPVVGFDFIVPDPSEPDYVIIEANERPGLANHEPQPTAERFIDYLFPQTRAEHKVGEAHA